MSFVLGEPNEFKLVCESCGSLTVEIALRTHIGSFRWLRASRTQLATEYVRARLDFQTRRMMRIR
jgi:hypothetical protein